MESVGAILSHTPVWVYILFGFLVSRGIKALKPGEASPARLALVPALLTAWGLYDLVRLYGIQPGSVLPWIGAVAIGAAFGWMLLRFKPIEADRVRGVIRRPADFTVLPLVLLAFAVKYSFGVMAALSPALLMQARFRLADLALSGLLAGIFLGKFAVYLTRYLAQPVPPPMEAGTTPQAPRSSTPE